MKPNASLLPQHLDYLKLRAIRGFNSLCRGLAGHHDRLVDVGRRFLSDEPWIAERRKRGRSSEPAPALGSGGAS